MAVTGEPDGRPLKAGTAVVDLVCGLLAANGIQAALVERARTGVGRHVEVSLMDSALTCLLNQGTAWVAAGVQRPAARQPPPEHRPLRDLRDRRPADRDRGRQRAHVRAAVRGARAARAAADERFATNEARVAHADELAEALRGRAARRSPPSTGSRVLREAKVPAGPINGVDEAFALAEELGMEPVEDGRRRCR